MLVTRPSDSLQTILKTIIIALAFGESGMYHSDYGHEQHNTRAYLRMRKKVSFRRTHKCSAPGFTHDVKLSRAGRD